MYGDYGCDDMEWLIETSGKANAVKVERDGKEWLLPIGRFVFKERFGWRAILGTLVAAGGVVLLFLA